MTMTTKKAGIGVLIFFCIVAIGLSVHTLIVVQGQKEVQRSLDPTTPTKESARRSRSESWQKIVDAQQKAAISDKLNRLDERLDKMEQARATGEPDAAANAGGGDPAEQDNGQETHGLSDKEFMAQMQVEFERQSLDPTWAVLAKQRFEQDLTALSKEQQFVLKGVECRSTGCIAIAEYDNYAIAFENYMKLLTAIYGVNCATAASVPAPEEADRDKPYQATIFFRDCQK